MDCPICLDPLSARTEHISPYACCHRFHTECDTEWSAACFKSANNTTCPVCRAPRKIIRTVHISTSSRDKTATLTNRNDLLLTWTSQRHTDRIRAMAHATGATQITESFVMYENLSIYSYITILNTFFKSGVVSLERTSLTSKPSIIMYTQVRSKTSSFSVLCLFLFATICDYSKREESDAVFRRLQPGLTRFGLSVKVPGSGSVKLSALCDRIISAPHIIADSPCTESVIVIPNL